MCEKLTHLAEAKLKEVVFVALVIREMIFDSNFKASSEMSRLRYHLKKLGIRLSNVEYSNFELILTNMVAKFEILADEPLSPLLAQQFWFFSWKLWRCMWGAGETFSSGHKENRETVPGSVKYQLMGDNCWSLYREPKNASHWRKSNTRNFTGRRERKHKKTSKIIS